MLTLIEDKYFLFTHLFFLNKSQKLLLLFLFSNNLVVINVTLH